MRGKGIQQLLLQKAKSRSVMLLRLHSLLSSPTISPLSCSSCSRSTAAMSSDAAPKSITDQKRALRSKMRSDLKAFSPAQRAQEDMAIQNNVLDSSWFKSASSLCAYVSCEALREVDTSRILSKILKNQDAGE
ncbi:uncharacterized protein A4U43_C03F11140 [Asparagus officinalis]|uniref:5-formyltetrahydrofolate cyclo-ligase n=1 Tax=Asparagus officinalis TaxID=4686 RepID=A0A5P1FBU4_ASPOF|nr:uncharacterized protein A4U43_C03F11140 [Asparagus officinalis]